MHPHIADLDATAALLHVARRTAASWAQAGRIPAIKVGGQWRFWTPAVIEAMGGPRTLPPSDDPVIVTPEDVAEMLGLSHSATYQLLRSGAIPAVKAGSRWRIHWPTIRDSIINGQSLG